MNGFGCNKIRKVTDIASNLHLLLLDLVFKCHVVRVFETKNVFSTSKMLNETPLISIFFQGYAIQIMR